MATKTARLLVSCPDKSGLIAAVAGFLAEHNGNILEADEHVDAERGWFFLRIEIGIEGFELNEGTFGRAWAQIADRHEMRWRMCWGDRVKRVAIFASRADHCLTDLLWRWRTGELGVEIPLVISNHDDLREMVERAGAAYHHLPITHETKADQEQQAIGLLRAAGVDLIVLARYMQVLSPAFLREWSERVINIHHSFLPAFAGARPYHSAYERGVKLIGATSHYVTEELDAGPIIAQETTAIDHRDSVEDLIRKGRDLERVVLARAVRLHVEDKILVSENKTVVFG